MRILMLSLCSLTLLALSAGVARAQGGDDRPAGTTDSGAITLEQLNSELQRLVSQRYGVVINYVLPRGWEVAEEGRDPATGKVREGAKVYALLSRRPMPDPSEPTDFIFELDVYDVNLLEGAPKDEAKQKEVMWKNFWTFLDAQMSINLKGGLKVLTQRRDINPKLYGPEGSRPKTMFVPISYEVPKRPNDPKSQGARLFTFTSITDGKVWVLKFLVSQDQVQNYEALIALIVNNAFGLSDEQYAQLQENTKAFDERVNQARDKQKNKGTK